jgi:hypothetical protein
MCARYCPADAVRLVQAGTLRVASRAGSARRVDRSQTGAVEAVRCQFRWANVLKSLRHYATESAAPVARFPVANVEASQAGQANVCDAWRGGQEAKKTRDPVAPAICSKQPRPNRHAVITTMVRQHTLFHPKAERRQAAGALHSQVAAGCK